MNQVMEADVVYVRNFIKADNMDIEQLKHLALIAHYCCDSFDLSARCLHHLAERGAVAPDALSGYLGALAPR